MVRRSWWTLTVLAVLAAVGTTSAPAQFNPGGSIQTRGWNYLISLLNTDGCGGGGDAKMRQNWVAPFEIGLEDPQAGEEWEGILFGAGAAAAGINQGNLTANPTWVTNDFLEGAFGLAAGTIPNADIADWDGIVTSINTNIVPAKYFLIALRGVVLKGQHLGDVLQPLAALVIFATVVLGLSALRLSRR